MTKEVIKVGSRGTSKRKVAVGTQNWAGKAYKDVMKTRKDKAKDVYISVGRGTSKIKMGDITDTTGRSSGKGRYVSTGRGTGRRKIQ